MAPNVFSVVTEDVSTTETLKMTATMHQCQICLEDFASDVIVTRFCGETCSAHVCIECLKTHLHLSVTAAFAGVLPKVRCPICLVQVAKTAWEGYAPEVLQPYKQACRIACSFRAPCCHDANYTHLPYEIGATDKPHKYIEPTSRWISTRDQAMLDLLHEQTHRFCAFEISAKELILFMEETFGAMIKAQHEVFEHELRTIADEERRATLLLAYHAKYKTVKTRCCGIRTCFNCKRKILNHRNGKSCEDELVADCVLECRSCHVTMVLSEGCNSVICWCGYAMDWNAEVRIRDRNKKQLIPVDIYDINGCAIWETWFNKLSSVLNTSLLPESLTRKKTQIDEALIKRIGLRETLRRFVQRVKWRHRFQRAFEQFQKELGDERKARNIARLTKSTLFVEAVRRAKWRLHWHKVVTTLHTKQFWNSYKQQYPTEQQHLEEEEMFVAYELSARLVAFLDDLVVPLGLTELSYQEFIDSIAVRIRDDERRASLIIAFHSVHKRVITRCCLMHFCFICHRQWNDTHEENPQGPCDSHDLVADNMVQCRACRVMLVKVEGCDAVQCPCGFRMRWSHELSVRKDLQYGRIPTTIDPLDLEMFELWDEWRGRVYSMIRYEVLSLRDLWRKRELNRGLVHSRAILRRLVQRYIWSRRFQTMYPDVVKHVRNAYRWRLIRTLRRHGFVRQTIYVWIAWRVCLKRIRCAVEAYDEETVDENEVKLEMGLFGF